MQEPWLKRFKNIKTQVVDPRNKERACVGGCMGPHGAAWGCMRPHCCVGMGPTARLGSDMPAWGGMGPHEAAWLYATMRL